MSDVDARVAKALGILEKSDGALLAFVGPTASGKTELAMRVAELVGGEIVSVDSVQVYRGFDLGSGKPTAEERARVPHHVVDVFDPLDAVDAARFADLADRAIADIRARGKVPVLCGGTFLWMKALLFGLAEAAAANEEIRARHREEAETNGRTSLHARLAKIDPASAARLHPNDVVRVSRALEVFELTGRPLSDVHKDHGFAEARHRAELVAVERAPEELTERIRARVRGWLEGGWLEETARLEAAGFGESRAMKTVGYLEVRDHLRGHLSKDVLEDTIVRRTRVFARRQRTWLNRPGAPLTWL